MNSEPTEYTWLCSCHFIGGSKSDDPTSPAFVPTLFDHVKSPAKRKVERQLARYERTSMSKKRRLQTQPECAKEAARDEYEMLHSPLGDHDDSPSLLSETTSTEHVHIMTDMIMDNISRLERECANLREENIRIQSELQKEKFLDSPKKVCYLPSIFTFNRNT